MVHLAKNSRTGGFAMSALPLLQRILSLACDNICLGEHKFVHPVCCILDAIRNPFVRVRANEEFHSKDVICDTLVVLSSIVDSPGCGSKIVLAATKAVKSQLERKSVSFTAIDDLRPSMWQAKQEAVGRSGIIKILLSAFRRIVNGYRAKWITNITGGKRTSRYVRGSKRERKIIFQDGGVEAVKAADFLTISLQILGSLVSVLDEIACTTGNAKALVREGTPLVLFRALEIVAAHRHIELVSNTISVLWKLLEVSEDSLQTRPAPSPHSRLRCLASRAQLLDRHRSANCQRMVGTALVANSLCSLLERSIVTGFRARDKDLRNNVLVTISLLARRAQNQRILVASGLLSSLLLYSCAQEVGLPSEADQHNFATQSAQDFEFKRLIWQQIADICANAVHAHAAGGQMHARPVFHAVGQAPLVQALLLYLNATGLSPSGLHWSRPQMRTLTIDACSVLLDVLDVPGIVTEFLERSGPSRIFRFVRQLLLTDTKSNSSESLLDSNGRQETLVPMRRPVPRTGADAPMAIASMRIFGKCARLCKSAERLCETDVMICLVAMLQIDLKGNGELTSNVHAICAGVIADLCDPDLCSLNSMAPEKASRVRRAAVINQKMFRRAGGVEIVRRALDVTSDQLAMNGCQFSMALIDLVWRCIVGNRRNEAAFISDDGVDVILNLVERAPVSMRTQVCGCLSDLMANPAARPYFRAWRSGKYLYGAAAMCLRLWAVEEHRTKVDRGHAGVLLNLCMPLSSTNTTNSQIWNVVSPSSVHLALRHELRQEQHKTVSNIEHLNSGRHDLHGLPISFPPPTLRGGTKYERLREALAAAKDLVFFGDQKPDAGLVSTVSDVDIRVKIWSLLATVGWDRLNLNDDDTATEAVLIALEVARGYNFFASMRAWTHVKFKISSEHVPLICSDKLALEVALETNFQLATQTRYSQLNLLNRLQSKYDHVERAFYDDIHKQQEQEIQAHLVTRHMVSPEVRIAVLKHTQTVPLPLKIF